MRVFFISTGVALLASLAGLGEAQQTRRAVKPTEQISVPPVTVSWTELLQLQSSMPQGGWGVDQQAPAPIELPIVELPLPEGHVLQRPAPANAPDVQKMTGCTGFPSEPPIGLDFASQGDVPDGAGFSFIPPNVAGAVGPDHVMTMLNNKVLIQDRLGSTVSTMDPYAFWSLAPTPGSSLAFPRVNYDSVNDKWIATVRSGTGGTMNILLAVSTTDDPTGFWNFHSIPADLAGTTFPDWVLQGYNSKWITITANMFNVVGGASVGAKMWVVDRTTIGGLLAVSVFPNGFMTTVHGSGGSSPFPTSALDNSMGDMYLLNDSFTAGGVFLIQLTQISGTSGSPVVTGLAGSPFGGSTAFCYSTTNFSGTQRTMAQVGDARFISPFSIRMASAVIRNGKIWCANSGGLPGPSTNASPTSNGLIWRQIDPSLPFPASPGAPASMMVQDGAVTSGTNTMSMYPSIAVNCAEDVLLGFSRGDATKNPEAAYCMRLGTDALGTMGATSVLKVGDSSYWKNFGVGTTAQWGLYTSTAVDPNDDETLWTIQEYAATRVGGADNDSRWGTWWGRLGDCDIRPVITDEPDAVFACSGDPVSFTVVATTGAIPLTYQWRLDGNDILGANADTYSIGSAGLSDLGAYDVVVSGCGFKISAQAALTFGGAAFTLQPTDATATVGSPAVFTVNAVGSGTVTYQWYADGNPIFGETASTYTIASVALADYFTEFTCVATDDCGPAESDVARVHPPRQTGKHQLAELTLHVFLSPESAYGCEGGQITFEATAYPASATYLWRKDGVVIVPNETANTLTLTNLSAADDGDYDVVVSDGIHTKQSTDATLTVIDEGVITSQPADKTGSVGGTATFTVVATGTNLTYQWKHRSNVPFAPFVDIVGATQPSYTIDVIQSSDAGSYRCNVINQCGVVQTRIARLTIL